MSESLPAQAIIEIERLAKAAQKSSFVVPPGETDCYAICRPDGTTELKKTFPPRHGEQIASAPAMAEFCLSIAPRLQKSDSCMTTPAIFICDQAITLVHDLSDRRDRSVCPLNVSEQFDWLLDNRSATMTQAELVRLLRIKFRGCHPSENLVPLLRQLKFAAAQNTERDIGPQRESLGRSVTASVSGVDSIPEEFHLSVPVFTNGSEQRYVIALALECLPAEQNFRITPLPGELDKAVRQELLSLQLFMAAADLPIFLGSP